MQLSVKPLPGLLVALLNIIKEWLYQELCAPLLIEVPCLLPGCYCAKPHVTLIYLVSPVLLSCVLTNAHGEKRMIQLEFVGWNSTFCSYNITRCEAPFSVPALNSPLSEMFRLTIEKIHESQPRLTLSHVVERERGNQCLKTEVQSAK